MEKRSFAERLLSIKIPSNMSMEEQQKALDPLIKTAHALLPDRLYRFRSCSDLSIGAFDKDELWASTADCMNDGFDTRFYIDKKAVKEQLYESLKNNTDRASILNMLSSSENLPQPLKQVASSIRNLSEEDIGKNVEAFTEFVKFDTEEAIQNINSVGQQAIKFCCFSENIKSPTMWGIYASDETGFALEYDFTQLPYAKSPSEIYTRECTLFPMIYGDERFKVPNEYVVFLLQYRLMHMAMVRSGFMNIYPEFAKSILGSGVCPDNLMATKISIHKSKEWEREAEWRLFCSSMNDGEFMNAKHGCCIKKPTAIYLGRRIKPINEKILRKLAEEKSIPVYKMKLDDESPAYEMLYE